MIHATGMWTRGGGHVPYPTDMVGFKEGEPRLEKGDG